MRWTRLRESRTGFAAALFAAAFAFTTPVFAQSTDTPAASTPASSTPAGTTPATPSTSSAPATTSAPAATTAPAPAAPPSTAPAPSAPATTPAPGAPAPDSNAGASPGDSSISQTIEVQPHPAIVISGSSTWDSGFQTITDAFAKLSAAADKEKIATHGHPLAVFTSTDDAGFKYSAMLPIDAAPPGKTELTPDVKFGETPSGKAIRFQHRASYDDIDSTYEAITAYLDEKGLESKNMFAEEYLKMTKTNDDPSLEVDIYVFLK